MLENTPRVQPIIIAGGKGSRLGSSMLPKPLVLLKNRPLVQYILDSFESTEFLRPYLIVGHKNHLIKQHFPDELFIIQDQQLGSGHAVQICEPVLKNKAEIFLLIFGDSPLWSPESFLGLIEAHQKGAFDLTIASVKEMPEYFKDRARIIRDKAGNLLALRKLKSCSEEDLKSKEFNADIFICSNNWLWEVLELLDNHNVYGEYNLSDIVELSIKHSKMVQAIPIENWWEALGVNTMEQLQRVEEYLNHA